MPKMPKDTEMRVSAKFQNRLKVLLDDEQCHPAEFAKSAGISVTVISRATLYGIIPSTRSLVKIADGFQISVSYLLGESDVEVFYPSDKSPSFAERLEELRKESNTKYSVIAKKMTFAENFFQEWLRKGSLPSLPYLKEVADYFHVSIDYLLGRTDDK